VSQLRVGDVVEIPTAKGLAYAQYTHKHPQMGDLVRVLPGLFPVRPESLGDLAKEKELFVIFFPLVAAVSKKIFKVIANEELPAESKRFPLFRAPGFVDRQGRVRDWWLWDGERSWQIGNLTDEQRRLPMRISCNDTALIQRIEEGWTPETDARSQG
jgi:hypothetical protein